jgi:hypothetical protein
MAFAAGAFGTLGFTKCRGVREPREEVVLPHSQYPLPRMLLARAATMAMTVGLWAEVHRASSSGSTRRDRHAFHQRRSFLSGFQARR